MNQELQTAPERKSAEEIEAFDGFMHAFEAFKEANDERLGRIERKVAADVLTVDKVDRINRALDEQKRAMDQIVLKNRRPQLGHDGGPLPSHFAVAAASSTAPNPASLTPSGGSANYLWLAVFHAGSNQPATGYPTNYTNGQTIGIASSGSATASAQRALTASSEDPGAFTIASSAAWAAYTVAIKP